MVFTLPDPMMSDPAFLAASMHEGQFINNGTQNDVWRIDGLKTERSYVLRVGRDCKELFAAGNLRAEVRATAAMDARAAQPIVVFFSTDTSGAERQVADIQPEISGQLLGLTTAQRLSRSYTIPGAISDDFPAEMPRRQLVLHTENIATTNELMWWVAERIAAMPQRFFIQAIKDVAEIEENGFCIDASRATNFTLMYSEDRLGFVDLLPASKYRLAPEGLAAVLCMPANDIRSIIDDQADQARRAHLHQVIKAKMIGACDTLKIAYAPYRLENAEVERLRAAYGLVEPDGVRPLQLGERSIPMGHGLNAVDIKVPTSRAAARISRFALQLQA